MDFATLDEVDPRAAWSHEARAFTPWLAANLGRLGDALGLTLEGGVEEVRVGRYAADILARTAPDGSAVLIENQLESSDHTHLGQILTYLTGLKAQIVVWVAPDFREEHLSALRWLNESTVEPFSFFAVRLRVVRIGESPFAPLFDVVERPNNWDRRLQVVARETAIRVPLPRGAAHSGRATQNAFHWRPPMLPPPLARIAGGSSQGLTSSCLNGYPPT